MQFLRTRAVQGLAVAIVLSVVYIVLLARDGLPFNRPAIGTTAVAPNLITQFVQLAFALLVIFVASRVTRR